MTEGPGNGIPQPEPKKKVAKTILEVRAPDLGAAAAPAESSSAGQTISAEPAPTASPDPTLRKTILIRKIPKSFSEKPNAHPDTGRDRPPQDAPPASQPAPQSGAPEMPPPPPVSFRTTKKVAKTMLDHSVLWETVAKAAADLEVKTAEEMKKKASEPSKPFVPISNYKKAAPCPAGSNPADSKERCSFCPQCLLHVYDFKGMELSEAEELTFKRENRKDFSLYKRANGTFLTRDCPVGVKSRRQLVLAVVGGSLMVVGVLALLLLAPRPPQPTVVNQPGPGQSKADGDYWSASSPRGPSAQPAPAKPSTAPTAALPAGPNPSTAATTGSPASSTDADASPYWEYSNQDTAAPAPAPSVTPQMQLPMQAPAATQPAQPAPGAAPSPPTSSTSHPSPEPNVKYYGR